MDKGNSSRPPARGKGKPGRHRTAARRAAVSQGTRVPAFCVVGLGASAGGLEALEEFLSHLPPDTGMAFVVVTHQHPGHASLLPELLGKKTPLRVTEALDGQRAEPNRIYLSRAGHRLEIRDGSLHLVNLKKTDIPQLPIDSFFASLAADQGERAVGIVLSGTGTDGTLGLRAIRKAGGTTLAQEPESAKYAGMPVSAAATGAVDFVLPPREMAARLIAHVRGLKLPDTGPKSETTAAERLQRILLLLRNRTGHDFSAYKPSTVMRRLERRMGIHQLKGTQHYLRFLQENSPEADHLFREMLIGVTSFFRDSQAFRFLARKALPALLKGRPDGATVRAWCPGCSTGEEAYTLAILLRDAAEQSNKRLNIQVFGTDLDNRAIDIARGGVYPETIAHDVPREILARHFVRDGRRYRVKKSVRDLVVFATQNLIKDPPFTKLDLISCRNLLIYLNTDVQKRLLGLFHYSLKPHGLLFLGPSESINEFHQHFSPVDRKWRIFARKETSGSPGLVPDIPGRPFDPPPSRRERVVSAPGAEAPGVGEFEKLLAGRFAPASVVIDREGEICHIHGRTGDYLEPASGRPRLNLLEMAREELRVDLVAAVRRAAAGHDKAARESVRVQSAAGVHPVNITVTPLNDGTAVHDLLLVTFEPVLSQDLPSSARAPRAPTKRETVRLKELEQELQFTRESLRSTTEELQSSNEEMQSTNEELQSSNEELETSREEMQSLNEELQTLNTQLQTKVDALSQSNDDMQNLLNSTAIATLFLDTHLRIKRFTEQARAVIKLIPSDVGRPIGDLVSNLVYPELESDAAEVLRTLGFREREVQTKEGQWRLARILPYRTTENIIAGLVITFVDIDRLKQAEQAAQQAQSLAESIVTTLREPVLVLDTQLRVVSSNEAFHRFFRLSRAEVANKEIHELGGGQWTLPRLRRLLAQILARNNVFENFKLDGVFPRVGRRVLMLNARRLQREPGNAGLILLAMEDVTDKRGLGVSVHAADRSRAKSRTRS